MPNRPGTRPDLYPKEILMTQRTLRIGMKALAAAAAICATALSSAPASAAEPREDLRAAFDQALKGKKVAWAPAWADV